MGKDGWGGALGLLAMSALYAVVYFALSSVRGAGAEFGAATLPLVFGAGAYFFSTRLFRSRIVIAALAPVLGLFVLLMIEISFDWTPRDRIGIAGYSFVLAQTGLLAALGAVVAKGVESLVRAWNAA